MTTAMRISQAIAPHLISFDEVRHLFEQAVLAWRHEGDGSRFRPALEGLLGAIEDVRLHGRLEPDASTRFVLSVLRAEAEAMLRVPSGTGGGTPPEACFSRDRQGQWRIECPLDCQLDCLAPDALAAQLERFADDRLGPFLRGWGAPSGRLLAMPLGVA